MVSKRERAAQAKTATAAITEGLDEIAALVSGEQGTDKSALLGQWIRQGAELAALSLIAEGKLSRGYAAELLSLSAWDCIELGERRGVILGPSEEQVRQSYENAQRLIQEQRSDRKVV